MLAAFDILHRLMGAGQEVRTEQWPRQQRTGRERQDRSDEGSVCKRKGRRERAKGESERQERLGQVNGRRGGTTQRGESKRRKRKNEQCALHWVGTASYTELDYWSI